MAWIVLLLLAAVNVSGQERFQVYTTETGLPHNSVLAIHQARDGYLWFTTYRGLVRFDGVQFHVFDPSNTPAIRGTNFAAFSLMEDRSGALWAGTWATGAIRYQGGTFRSLTTADGLPNNSVVRIDEDDKGTIWVFTSPGVSRVHNGKAEVVQAIGGEPVQPYLTAPPNLGVDSYLLGLWRYSHSGLQRFAYGKWSDVPLPKDVRDPRTVQLESLLEDSQRRIWFSMVGRPGESFCVENGRLTTFHGLPLGAFANYQDKLGRLWITDHEGHTGYWQNGRTTPLAGVSTPSIYRVVEDSEGTYWIGTLNQGLAHGMRPVVTTVRLPGGPEANNIRAITQDGAGDLWAGSHGLTRIHAGGFRTFLFHPGISWHEAQNAAAVWAEADGTIYCGYAKGVKILRHERFEDPDRPLLEIKSEVNAIIRDRAGDLWLGASEGLFRYHAPTLKRFDDGNSGIRGDVRALYQDRNGTVWIGTDDVLCRYRDGRLSCFGSSDPLSQWRVRTITGDADNVIWVGTSAAGVLRISGSDFQWIKAKDGLYTNDADAILEDSKGYFWISSPLGLYRVRKQELNAFAEHRLDHVSSTIFGKMDGLNNLNCTGNDQPRALIAKDGILWFPTQDGLARIDPQNVTLNDSPPRVQIESCTLEQRPIACGDQISVPPGGRALEIKYTALDLIKSDQIKFKYQLQGLDTSWVNAGSRRTAYYSHLAPGNYRFRVTAANSDGMWSSSDKELPIIVQPQYYESAWFRTLLAGMTVSLFVFAWRARAARFGRERAQQRAFAQQIIASQELERKRIARELHDDLGQHLSLIKNLALLANRSDGKKHQEQIDAIAGEASHALSEVRQISHNLRPYRLDMLGLTKAIEVLAAETCEAAGIRADVVADDLSGLFAKETEIHLYRVVQESLNNIIKHSQATQASVLIQRTANGAYLVITDNGIGFDAANREDQVHGFGLRGISERAQLLGGKAKIESTPGQGTTVVIELDARGPSSASLRAYPSG